MFRKEFSFFYCKGNKTYVQERMLQIDILMCSTKNNNLPEIQKVEYKEIKGVLTRVCQYIVIRAKTSESSKLRRIYCSLYLRNSLILWHVGLTLPLQLASLFCKALQHHTSPTDWARDLFKSSTDSASLVAQILKKIRFGFGVFWGNDIMGGCFCLFG